MSGLWRYNHKACNGSGSKKATELLAEIVTFSIIKLAPCIVEAFIVLTEQGMLKYK